MFNFQAARDVGYSSSSWTRPGDVKRHAARTDGFSISASTRHPDLSRGDSRQRSHVFHASRTFDEAMASNGGREVILFF